MSDSKRIGIYLRVSTLDQSTELQKTELNRYCGVRGFQNVTVFEDKASGTNTTRAQFQALMRAARNRELDTIIIWKLDRFARSLNDLVTNVTELTELGVEFISLKDNIDLSTASGRLMVHLLASFAEFEAALIKERVCAGLANAKRKGTKLGRPRVANETKIIELRGQGLSLSAIARQLGISKSAVHKTLTPKACIKPSINAESTQVS